jgi:histidine phosphotransferase ChpT
MTVKLLELLSSKLCHDLISPIGAVNNGIEFMQEMGPESFDDAKDLIAYSAQQASSKLQAYRLAFGSGGADITHKPEDVYKAIDGVLAQNKKVSQDWDPLAFTHLMQDGMSYPIGFCKVVTSLLLLVIESMPRGGVLSVRPQMPDSTVIDVMAAGQGAVLRDGVEAALRRQTPESALHAKTMHAYFTALMAEHYNFDLSVKEDTDRVTLTLCVEDTP